MTLRKTLLRRNFQNGVFDVIDIHKYIPYHIDMLTRGDRQAREDFRFIQGRYTTALMTPTRELREYIQDVKLQELEGFSVPPISRPFDDNMIWEYDDDSDSDDSVSSDDSTSSEELEKPKTDEETKAGLKSQPPLSIVLPSDIQEPQHDQKGYDENGFYLEIHESSIFNPLHKKNNDGDTAMVDRPPSPSPAYEGDDIEAGALTLASSSGESISFNSSSLDFSLVPSPSLPLLPCLPTTGREVNDEPLSEALCNLLREIGKYSLHSLGGDVNTTRSNDTILLESFEFSDPRGAWVKEVATLKRREMRRGRNGYESWTETDYLDTFDSETKLFNWQKEGLFLCRLTELVYKEKFIEARVIFWAEYKVERSKKGLPYKKPPGSPLRKELTQ
ncbi:hypothetical protein GGR51DRAFT_572018 [Nemania sp. FL0031]|nr:hypothetical protein GGR51DRAFT_572018 [Nemania sp. FL0031]